MPEIANSTLKEESKRLTDKMNWDNDSWNADRSAAVALRVVLKELGCTEVLGDDHKADRAAVLAIIKPLFTAPKNFAENYLVPSKLAPEKIKAEKIAVDV